MPQITLETRRQIREYVNALIEKQPDVSFSDAYRMVLDVFGVTMSANNFRTTYWNKAVPPDMRAARASRPTSSVVQGRQESTPRGKEALLIESARGRFTAERVSGDEWVVRLEIRVPRSVAVDWQGQAFALLFPREGT